MCSLFLTTRLAKKSHSKKDGIRCLGDVSYQQLKFSIANIDKFSIRTLIFIKKKKKNQNKTKNKKKNLKISSLLQETFKQKESFRNLRLIPMREGVLLVIIENFCFMYVFI